MYVGVYDWSKEAWPRRTPAMSTEQCAPCKSYGSWSMEWSFGSWSTPTIHQVRHAQVVGCLDPLTILCWQGHWKTQYCPIYVRYVLQRYISVVIMWCMCICWRSSDHYMCVCVCLANGNGKTGCSSTKNPQWKDRNTYSWSGHLLSLAYSFVSDWQLRNREGMDKQ